MGQDRAARYDRVEARRNGYDVGATGETIRTGRFSCVWKKEPGGEAKRAGRVQLASPDGDAGRGLRRGQAGDRAAALRRRPQGQHPHLHRVGPLHTSTSSPARTRTEIITKLWNDDKLRGQVEAAAGAASQGSKRVRGEKVRKRGGRGGRLLFLLLLAAVGFLFLNPRTGPQARKFAGTPTGLSPQENRSGKATDRPLARSAGVTGRGRRASGRGARPRGRRRALHLPRRMRRRKRGGRGVRLRPLSWRAPRGCRRSRSGSRPSPAVRPSPAAAPPARRGRRASLAYSRMADAACETIARSGVRLLLRRPKSRPSTRLAPPGKERSLRASQER